MTAGALARRAAWAVALLAAAPATAARADDNGVLVVTAFGSDEPTVGKLAMAVLHLQVWQTMRKPRSGGPTKIVYWDESVAPRSYAEAEEVALTDEAPMALWGRAWDYKPGLAIQAYLSVRGDLSQAAGPIWKVNLPRHGPIQVAVPARRYDFTPIVVKSAVATAAGKLTAIPVYDAKGSTVAVGALGESFKALQQDGEWAKVQVDGRTRWVHLPGLDGQRSEIVSFLGGLIRLRRGDWDGARALLEPLARDPRARTNVRAHAYLLLAAAAAQQPSPNVASAIAWTEQARAIAPFDPATVKYACMAHFAAFATTGARAHLAAVSKLLASARDVLPPGDAWVKEANRASIVEGHGQE